MYAVCFAHVAVPFLPPLSIVYVYHYNPRRLYILLYYILYSPLFAPAFGLGFTFVSAFCLSLSLLSLALRLGPFTPFFTRHRRPSFFLPDLFIIFHLSGQEPVCCTTLTFFAHVCVARSNCCSCWATRRARAKCAHIWNCLLVVASVPSDIRITRTFHALFSRLTC